MIKVHEVVTSSHPIRIHPDQIVGVKADWLLLRLLIIHRSSKDVQVPLLID